MKDRAVLLHNVRSAHNVGSIFRTADGAGVSRMFLSGYTPLPIDRFGHEQKDIAKTALGAEKYMSWEYAKNPITLIKRLRNEGWKIVGVEQDTRAIDYRKLLWKGNVVYVFGNEVLGLSRKLRDACDELIEIPMQGQKESLNVSVAAGIILFQSAK